MSHQNHCLLPTQRLQTVLEEFLRHFGVNSGNGIVHQIDVRICVESSRQHHSRLLSSWKRGSSFSHNGAISLWENPEVRLQTGNLHDSFVLLLVEGLPESDVVADSVWEDDGLLLDIGEGSVVSESSWAERHLSENGAEETALSWAYFSCDPIECSGSKGEGDVFEDRCSQVLVPKTVEISKLYKSFNRSILFDIHMIWLLPF